jgi:hypothetical protein
MSGEFPPTIMSIASIDNGVIPSAMHLAASATRMLAVDCWLQSAPLKFEDGFLNFGRREIALDKNKFQSKCTIGFIECRPASGPNGSHCKAPVQNEVRKGGLGRWKTTLHRTTAARRLRPGIPPNPNSSHTEEFVASCLN